MEALKHNVVLPSINTDIGLRGTLLWYKVYQRRKDAEAEVITRLLPNVAYAMGALDTSIPYEVRMNFLEGSLASADAHIVGTRWTTAHKSSEIKKQIDQVQLQIDELDYASYVASESFSLADWLAGTDPYGHNTQDEPDS